VCECCFMIVCSWICCSWMQIYNCCCCYYYSLQTCFNEFYIYTKHYL